SLSGQMSAPVLLDKDGRTLGPSILIADVRSSKQTARLRETYSTICEKMTGNRPIDAFTVAKLLWLKENRPDMFRQAKCFVFPKDYIRYRLTGRIATEPTDAGNSLLFDYQTRKWNVEMIRELGFEECLFPNIMQSTDIAGYITSTAAHATNLNDGTPVIAGAADMACSSIGTGAILQGTVAVTLSTSAQVVTSLQEIRPEGIGKVTFHPQAGKLSLYTMGSIFTGGLGFAWSYKLLHDRTEMKKSEIRALTEKMREITPGSDGVMFLPFLVGSGTPFFHPDDTAAWIGLRYRTDRATMMRAVMEGIAYNICDSIQVFQKMGLSLEHIRLGAGGSRNPVWCQIIADVLGYAIDILAVQDASTLGACLLAGLGLGVYDNVDQASSRVVKINTRFNYNDKAHQIYKELYQVYRNLYTVLHAHSSRM
ncbi:MAG TPA: FGGY family carbohydrate kinase, partial [Bacilli bacterium]